MSLSEEEQHVVGDFLEPPEVDVQAESELLLCRLGKDELRFKF